MHTTPRDHKMSYTTFTFKDLMQPSDFLDMTPKTQATKAKKNKWDYIQLRSFCAAKQTISKLKRQPTEWEKISAIHISDKGLISKIYKGSYNSTAKTNTNKNTHKKTPKPNNLIFKMGKNLSRYFSKEDI